MGFHACVVHGMNSCTKCKKGEETTSIKYLFIIGAGTGMAGMVAAIPTFTQTMCHKKYSTSKYLNVNNFFFFLPYLFEISSGAAVIYTRNVAMAIVA